MKNFTFRNRKKKDLVLNKINNFFDKMETIEKKIDKENGYCRQKLEQLEKTLNYEYGRFSIEKIENIEAQ